MNWNVSLCTSWLSVYFTEWQSAILLPDWWWHKCLRHCIKLLPQSNYSGHGCQMDVQQTSTSVSSPQHSQTPQKQTATAEKVKVHTLDIAPLRSESPPQKRSGMARVLKGFHSFTCTPTSEWAIPAFAFPAAAGTHLPTPQGWKAEWTLVRSSPGWDSNLQPPDCKSGTLPHSH